MADWFGVPVTPADCYDDLPADELMAVNVLLAVESEMARPKEERSLRHVMHILGVDLDEMSESESV